MADTIEICFDWPVPAYFVILRLTTWPIMLLGSYVWLANYAQADFTKNL